VDDATFKQILRYMDELHQDLSRLVVLIERLMPEKGYVVVPGARNAIGWNLSSHYAMPDRWRLTNVTRIHVREGDESFDHSLLYFINLASDTRFLFPTMLCARLVHSPLPADVIYGRVWNIARFFDFGLQEQGKWRLVREERGWTIVEPVGDTLIQSLQGYLLNVFDLVDRQHVIDNIILPLTEPRANLDELLTIEKYSLIAAEEGAA
jgi:hypothetical protein